eukprot:TRINITY_DN2329_c0_g2_i4.p1 TRINITY_DN2329_c0_g2~~TRINITY_DN2329_c0_g2_i4.p1  ORF type:complete len:224 (-),score=46.86 TRINITY_DN2329_c0_g2_i4:253-924(-)
MKFPILSAALILQSPAWFSLTQRSKFITLLFQIATAKKRLRTLQQVQKRNEKSRQFGYLGYKSEDEAKKAKEYFDGTYLDTGKIAVDFAYPQNSELIPRAWSRHSKVSSAYGQTHKPQSGMVEEKKEKEGEPPKSAAIIEEIEKKKAKYKEFLDYIAKKRTPKQSWNDVFNNFVSRKEKEKRSKSNAEEIAIKKEEAVAAPQRKARKVQKEKRKVLWMKKGFL